MKASELKQIAKSIESHRRKDKQIALAGIKKFVEESPSQVSVTNPLAERNPTVILEVRGGLLYACNPITKWVTRLDELSLELLVGIIENLSKNV